jgi:hypothetical protein
LCTVLVPRRLPWLDQASLLRGWRARRPISRSRPARGQVQRSGADRERGRHDRLVIRSSCRFGGRWRVKQSPLGVVSADMARFGLGSVEALAAFVLVAAAAACSGGASHSAGSSPSTGSQGAAVYSRGCSQAVGGVLPATWRKSGVVVGSLALYSFGQVTHEGAVSQLDASAFTRGRDVKMLALVRPGAVVSLGVPPSERRAVSLDYRPGVIPSTVAEGDAVVTFHACASPSGAGPGLGGWTQFNGGILVAGARCVKFLVRSRSGTAGLVLAFGSRTC